MVANTGIYSFVHKASGKRYVGQTATSFTKRKSAHEHALRNDKHQSPKFKNAIRKHGMNAFKFVVLERIDLKHLSKKAARNLLCKREQHWMDKTRPEYLLNCAPTAGSILGIKISWGPKRRAINLAANRKFHSDQKFRAKHRAAMRKVHASLNWRIKMLAGVRKRVADPKWRANNLAHLRKLRADPKWRVKNIAALRKCYADPNWRAKILAANRKLANDSKWRASMQRVWNRKRASP